MKKSTLTLLVAASVPFLASADVTVKFPAGEGNGTYAVQQMLISDVVKPRAERPELTVDSVKAANSVMTFQQLTTGPAQCIIPIEDRKSIRLFTEPGMDLNVVVTSMQPLDYTVTGSELMEGIMTINNKTGEISKQYSTLSKAEPRDEKAMEALLDDYNKYLTDYIANNATNPASLYAALQISDKELFLNTVEGMGDDISESPLYPILNTQKESTQKRLEADKQREELASGNHDAPAFTLKDLDGKDVSVSDFKGKWVILDFWGTWCPWCIKGFPKLKETYASLKDRLEVIGIDCRESEDAWRKGVVKYELPWINVYNPDSSNLLNDYHVQGFPTKVIINPEGKIVNITVGENPAFFDKLAELMNGK
ncbi:MAG: TlpA family protein disulfide reductase [Duncaniella sp.]|nr:TlpA family protein disulfide reductase [Muribaculum sp.]MCM1254613.1 TlpA family protein disulfide reductase [Duncaniella sp.]